MKKRAIAILTLGFGVMLLGFKAQAAQYRHIPKHETVSTGGSSEPKKDPAAPPPKAVIMHHKAA